MLKTRQVYNLFQHLWNRFLFFPKGLKITKKGLGQASTTILLRHQHFLKKY